MGSVDGLFAVSITKEAAAGVDARERAASELCRQVRPAAIQQLLVETIGEQPFEASDPGGRLPRRWVVRHEFDALRHRTHPLALATRQHVEHHKGAGDSRHVHAPYRGSALRLPCGRILEKSTYPVCTRPTV